MLVANKSDLEEQIVKREEGESWADYETRVQMRAGALGVHIGEHQLGIRPQ